ncbi:GNAT family N-acetyltransferase [Fredinandcohnia sp. 179-A 10B2 NHS]|uniref:GNAT family N-acetyltransferase n=1 Tax=Fredinandcohnia sp. 179-A 10B2 NHS TaxID=3235176 RepID=UPI0039A16B09
MFPILETERLILREITKEDAGNIFACFSNPDVTKYYGQDPFTSISQAEQLVSLFEKNYQEKRGIRWGIELRGNSGIIGTIGFNLLSLQHRRSELGYELHPSFWGNGYATEAIHKVVQYGFSNLGLNRIGAVVYIENSNSNHVLEKIGFQKEGILRSYMMQGGASHDVNVYSLLRE